jgi:hypothetical protein
MFMEFGDPPMARRMLKGIKARAERIDAAQDHFVAAAAVSTTRSVPPC